jgi:hypothetical protein
LPAIVLVVVVYFVVFPEDVEAVVAPLAKLLSLTTVVSPWLYVVFGAWIVAWAIVRVWGPRRTAV